MSDALIGTVINERYRLTEILGQGGMGIVFRAEDLRLNNRLCAVKLLKGQTTDPNESKRFEAELQIISRLRSPHVVQVLDTGYFGGHRLYIVMELLEGAPLSQVIKQNGALPVHRAVQVCKGILAGLSEAHEYGIVHRDLKPANIFITQSRAGDEITKVLDFGIAKDTNQNDISELTSASMIIGTPKYMAPEQFVKQKTDPRTDLYAVGLLLYHMLDGNPPFVGTHPDLPPSLTTMPSEFRVGWLHVNAEPTILPVPEPLWHLLKRMLAKDPNKRPNQADDVITELNQILSQISGNGLMAVNQTPSVVQAVQDVPASSISHSSPQSVLDEVVQQQPDLLQSNVKTFEITDDDDPSTTGIPFITDQYNTKKPSKSNPPWLMWGGVFILALGVFSLWSFYGSGGPKKKPKKASAKVSRQQICHHMLHITPNLVTIMRVNPKTGTEVKLGMTTKNNFSEQRPCQEKSQLKFIRKGYQTQTLMLEGDRFKQTHLVTLKEAVAAPKEDEKKTKSTKSRRNKYSKKNSKTHGRKSSKKKVNKKTPKSSKKSPVEVKSDPPKPKRKTSQLPY